MGAIGESENKIREKYEAYNKELSKASSELSKVCAICTICTKQIIITKDGIKTHCADCGLKKSFDLHMKLFAQALEVKEKLKSI